MKKARVFFIKKEYRADSLENLPVIAGTQPVFLCIAGTQPIFLCIADMQPIFLCITGTQSGFL